MPSSGTNRVIPGSHKNVWYLQGGFPENGTNMTASAKSRAIRSMSWLQTPGYITKKRTGDLPMNAYSVLISGWQYLNGLVTTRSYTAAGTLTQSSVRSGDFGEVAFLGAHTVLESPQSSDTTSIDSRAVTKALLGIKDQKVNVLQIIAEREQTLSLVSSTARQIASSFSHLRRGDIVGAATALGSPKRPSRGSRKDYGKLYPKEPLKAAANLWLQWTYGWTPLLKDLHGLADHYNQEVTKDRIIKLSSKTTGSRNWEYVTLTTLEGWKQIHTQYRSWKYTRKYVIYYKIAGDTSKSISQLGFTNPALIGWELMPFSFVVDWFLPVGNFISSLDATVGCVFEKGCRTTVTKRSAVTETKADPTSSSKTFKVDCRLLETAQDVAISRTTLTSFPSVAMPMWKNPVTAIHAANAIALLTLAFYGHTRKQGAT